VATSGFDSPNRIAPGRGLKPEPYAENDQLPIGDEQHAEEPLPDPILAVSLPLGAPNLAESRERAEGAMSFKPRILADELSIDRQRHVGEMEAEFETIIDAAESARYALGDTHRDTKVRQAILHLSAITRLACSGAKSARALDANLQETIERLEKADQEVRNE